MIESELSLVFERRYQVATGDGSTMALKPEADGWITTRTKSMR